MTLKERAAKILASNKEKQAVHFTSDGMPFFNMAEAEGHASRFKDRTITTIGRAGAESKSEAPDPAKQPEISDEEKGQVAVSIAQEVKPEAKPKAKAEPEAKKSVTPKPKK
jgi:hypothetical protein